MKRYLLAAGIAMLAVSQHGHALSLSGTAGSDAYGLQGSTRIAPALLAGLGYYASDYRDADAKVYSGFLTFAPYTPLVDLSVGARYQYLDTAHGNGGGLGVTGSAYVPTPLPRVSLGGYAHYFPSALAHGDLDDSYELGANLRLRILGDSYLTGGYRYFKADFDGDDGGSRTLESGWVIGASIGF